ncbi:MAG: SlyX family protein [Oleiphilus sp.]
MNQLSKHEDKLEKALERLNELEMKVSFQDDLVNTLNDIVVRQDKEIMKLWDANRLLKQSMQEIRSNGKDEAVESPPPHY